MADFKQSSGLFWKQVSSVLSGTAVAQFIPVVGSLIIARQYLPFEFGVFSSWLGAVLVLAVILTGRFETSLAILEDGEPRRLAVICTCYTTILAAFVAFIFPLCWVMIDASSLFSSTIDITFFLMLSAVPVAMLVALNEVWQSWVAAEGHYRFLTTIRIVQAFSIVGLQIIFGNFSPTSEALAAAHGIGVLISLIVALIILPLGPLPSNFFHVVREFWWAQQRFPKLSLPADVINTAAAQLPIVIVVTRFGADIAGLLAMTMKVLGAPTGLLGRAVLDVFKRHASAAYRVRGECQAEYVGTFRVLAAASTVFCLVMFFASEVLFAVVFGEIWRGSGIIAVWMLPLFALRFVASPLSYMVYIAGKQHIDLIWQVSLLFVTFASLFFVNPYGSALQTYSIGYSVLYVIYLYLSYRFSLGSTR